MSNFDTQEKCLKFIKKLKYPKGIFCKKCHVKRKFYKVKRRPVFACIKCHSQVSILKDTIFEKTHIPLTLWFFAIFLLTYSKSGISASSFARMNHLSYKGAWRLFHKIRSVMTQDEILDGIVEVDETMIGGSAWNNYRIFGRRRHLPVVLGMVKRKGKAHLFHVRNKSARVVIPKIKQNIKARSHVMTDQAGSYRTLKYHGYKHSHILHRRQFKKGKVHTQTVEGLFSQFKRGITGTYRRVSAKHLQLYANEFSWRYSYGKLDELFSKIV